MKRLNGTQDSIIIKIWITISIIAAVVLTVIFTANAYEPAMTAEEYSEIYVVENTLRENFETPISDLIHSEIVESVEIKHVSTDEIIVETVGQKGKVISHFDSNGKFNHSEFVEDRFTLPKSILVALIASLFSSMVILLAGYAITYVVVLAIINIIPSRKKGEVEED